MVVDDDRDMLAVLKKVIARKCGCALALAESAEVALELLGTFRPDVVLTDIRMEGLDGLSLLEEIKKRDSAVSVIVMTGYGTVELAVRALKEGAYDFFEKPFDNDRVAYVVQRSLERTGLLRENLHLHEKLAGRDRFQGFVGRSPRLREIFAIIERVAATDVTVLIRGESGTGKELAARALHALSDRASRRMVAVNCPALPEQILESELFGYVRGAFTGATRDKKGLFLEADGSTILLDEIGDLPLSLQTKLLRVLQEREVQSLGQNRSIGVDVRVLASTNQDLEGKIRAGLFREDLFYRLNVVTLTMPSLRGDPDNIPVLARHFLATYGHDYDRGDLRLSGEALNYLVRRPWRGNVRELQNVIKRAVLLAAASTIEISDLAEAGDRPGPAGPDPAEVCHLPYGQAKQEVVAGFSRTYLLRALRHSHGNVSAAARASGMGRPAFQRLLNRYDLEARDFRSD
ncbi:MAG: response regulator [Proteobacteria bacterium]|nr:response regulator [Pseudomonadota bacterium]